MAELVYALCALTSFACAWLLLRAYARGGSRLLWWSGLCFVGLALNDLLLFLHTQPWAPEFGLSRTIAGLIGVSCLLYGLILDTE